MDGRGAGSFNVGKVAELNDIACASGGNCAAGGSFTATDGVVQAWIASEVNGRWGPAVEVPAIARLNAGGEGDPGGSWVTGLTCTAAATCVAAGQVGLDGFIAQEIGGTLLSVGGGGTTESDALACGTDGDCSVGGWIQYGADDQTASYSAYVTGHTPPAWVDETRGVNADALRSSWGTVRRVSAVVLDALRGA